MARNDDDIRIIERDLEETRARTESTIHALQNKLQPRAMLDEATRFFQGTDSGQYAEDLTRNGLAQARENPIPMALIASGIALLAAKRPGRPRYVNDSSDRYYDDGTSIEGGVIGGTPGYTERDFAQQDEELSTLYDAEWEETHRIVGADEAITSTYTRLDDEDDDAYQNRLYEARGKAFKVDREKDEDHASFRQRVDDRLSGAKRKRDEYKTKAGDFRRRQSERASNLKDRAGDLAHRAGDRGRAAYDGTRARASHLASDSRDAARRGARRSGELYEENPLIAAMVAVAAGAVTGAMFGVTDKERRALGGVADDINEGVKELNERANEKVAEYARKVQHAAEDADDKVSEVEKDLGSNKSGTTTTGTTTGTTGTTTSSS